jgi:hypothetical protein
MICPLVVHPKRQTVTRVTNITTDNNMANVQLDMSSVNERGEELAEEKMQSTVANSHNLDDCMKSNKPRSASQSEDSNILVWKLTFHYAKSVDL